MDVRMKRRWLRLLGLTIFFLLLPVAITSVWDRPLNYQFHGWFQIIIGAIMIGLLTFGDLKVPPLTIVGFVAMAVASELRGFSYLNETPEQFEPWTTLLHLAAAVGVIVLARQLGYLRIKSPTASPRSSEDLS